MCRESSSMLLLYDRTLGFRKARGMKWDKEKALNPVPTVHVVELMLHVDLLRV